MLITPVLVLMAYWYRKQLPTSLMTWKKPEMVIVTITFSVAALILFIVGVSCLFTYSGYLDTGQVSVRQERLLDIAKICGLLMVSLVLTYLAIRMLLVRVISARGIVVNDRIFRIPDLNRVVSWHDINDYYLVSDYPNVIFTLIVQEDTLQFSRFSIRVPVYKRDRFEDLLERQMAGLDDADLYEDLSRHHFPEN
ncbi:MAG: hypothetical protein AAF206_12530 [Bacteroidota bacterium]